MGRLLMLAAACTVFAVSISAGPASHVTYLLPETMGIQTPNKFKDLSPNDYEYHIIPSDEYAITKNDGNNYLLLLDTISTLSPFAIVSRIASCALSFGIWVLSNSGFIIFGAALAAAICGLTPYCTVTIDPSFMSHLHSFNVPYLNDLEHFFAEAYHKYHDM